MFLKCVQNSGGGTELTLIGSVSDNVATIDVKEYTSNWANLTKDDFLFQPIDVLKVNRWYSESATERSTNLNPLFDYNASTGILTVNAHYEENVFGSYYIFVAIYGNVYLKQ